MQTDDNQTAKADVGKLQISLVPTQIVNDIAEVRMYGNKNMAIRIIGKRLNCVVMSMLCCVIHLHLSMTMGRRIANLVLNITSIWLAIWHLSVRL